MQILKQFLSKDCIIAVTWAPNGRKKEKETKDKRWQTVEKDRNQANRVATIERDSR